VRPLPWVSFQNLSISLITSKVGSLPWDSQAAWDNKVLLATNPSYRSQVLVMCGC